ncbi:MarR family winged helix-turn-helix transcriptional regulator [Kitasatospora sp. NPDC059722]|uniref:MarR family winged helix-turn-helix transcriptional regulator n=1 Tax=Kitasatospora sp. NPDC059722 TaxID=3346925 RepID=UPI0036B66093
MTTPQPDTAQSDTPNADAQQPAAPNAGTPTPDPLDTALRLVRAQATLVKRFDASLSGLHGVSLSDFTMLLRLGEAPGGRMRRVDLAEALGLTASGVTRGLAPLERIGLVTREPAPRDARVAYAALTPTGRERLAEMRTTARQVAADVFAQWPAGDLTTLATLLDPLTGSLR